MKKIIAVCIVSLFGLSTLEAQELRGLLNKAKEVMTNKQGVLSNDDIVAGLKEALAVGSQKGSATLSQLDGFFKNAALKILMPPEVIKVEKALRSIGMGKLVDDAVLSMNRAAEDACKGAAPIFGNAIKQMSFQDALGILKGSDTAATAYLRRKTTGDLTSAFTPVIASSLEKVNATKYWSLLFTTYNNLPTTFTKINSDLSSYVTDKALSGIFYQVALEEKNIRKDPVARTSEILKKVFAK